MTNKFFQEENNVMSPASNGFVITPDDANDLPDCTRGIMVDAPADVFVDLVDGGTNIRLPNLAAGIVHPFRVKRVYAAGTTAAYILGVN